MPYNSLIESQCLLEISMIVTSWGEDNIHIFVVLVKNNSMPIISWLVKLIFIHMFNTNRQESQPIYLILVIWNCCSTVLISKLFMHRVTAPILDICAYSMTSCTWFNINIPVSSLKSKFLRVTRNCTFWLGNLLQYVEKCIVAHIFMITIQKYIQLNRYTNTFWVCTFCTYCCI